MLDEPFIGGEACLPAGAKENSLGEAQLGQTPTTLRFVLPQVASLEAVETTATRWSGICKFRRRIRIRSFHCFGTRVATSLS